MGAVFLAEDLTLSRPVAIKFMNRAEMAQNSRISVSQSMEKRFIREAKSAATINHPNIAQIYEANFDTDTWYIAMEFIDGQSLHEQLEENKKYTVEEVISICKQAIYGLDHAWNKYKIIHRDIKPHNIMLTPEGLVKIVDLGLAKPLEEHHDDSPEIELTGAGTPLGTPPYMAPEQAAGNKDINYSVDIYSLGATLYELFAGQRAFNEKSAPLVYMSQIQKKYTPLRELNPEIPESMVTLIDEMLEPKVEKRISSYRDIQTKLEKVLDNPSAAPHKDQNSPTTIPCPNCNQILSVNSTMQGTEVRCPKCQTTFKVPKITDDSKKAGLGGQSPQVFSAPSTTSKRRNSTGPVLRSFSPEECLILEQEYGFDLHNIKHLKCEHSWESGILAGILNHQINQMGESDSSLNIAMQIKSEFKQKRPEYHEFIEDQFKNFISLHKSLNDLVYNDLNIAIQSNELNTLFGFANKAENLLSKLKAFHETIVGHPYPKDKLTLDLQRFVHDWTALKLSKSLSEESLYVGDYYKKLHQILLTWTPSWYTTLNQLVELLHTQETKNRNSSPLLFQFSFLPPNLYQFYHLTQTMNIGFHPVKSATANLIAE